MKRRFSMLVVLGALSALVLTISTGAHASHCDSKVVVFGYTAGQTALNEGAAVCILDNTDHIADTRIINPGSTMISVRYLAGAAGEVAVIKGLGVDTTLPLKAHNGAVGTTWDTDAIAIDPTAIGAVTVDVTDATGVLDSTCFHTLGAESGCTDFTPDSPFPPLP